MSFSDLIPTLLGKQKLAYDVLHAPDAVSLRENWLEKTVPLSSVARLALLQDDEGLVLAFSPADRILNLLKLQTILHRDLHFADAATVTNPLIARMRQPDFRPDHSSGIQVIIDEYLTNLEWVHFEAPQASTLFRVRSLDLQNMAGDVLIGSVFSDFLHKTEPNDESTGKQDLRARITQLDRLPTMPDLPGRILALRNNSNSTVDQLVALVEQDWFLSAQILRYANNPMFGVRVKIVSPKDAIFRVLGYESALHLTLGYALGRVFKLPQAGPLGQEQYWQHATYSAALVQRLANAMSCGKRPKPGLAYLAGLLHDIGFLVLNQFFQDEHALLNNMISANPDQPVLDLERRLLGVTHNELGAWLMQAWRMPKEIFVAIKYHHDLDYHGPHDVYARLLNLSERLLKMHNMSDAESDEIPPQLLKYLDLQEEQVFLILDEVLTGGNTLREMAHAICI